MAIERNINVEIEDDQRFINDLKSNKPFIEIGGENIWELGFETFPREDFKEPEEFPNCCEYHSELLDSLNTWFEEFPECCNNHKKLLKKRWFKKEKYSEVPLKVVRQLMFTSNFILAIIDSNDWFKEITDYLEYNFESFGTPSVGGGQYISNLRNWLETPKSEENKFPEWKKNQIIEFLNNTVKPSEKPKTDINILFNTFQKWIKTFPDLEFFNKLKKDHTGRFPLEILLYEPQYNPYTGLTKFQMRTKSELIEILIKSTKNFLLSVNTPLLLKNNLISDDKKYQLDLLNEQHILKQNNLLVEYTTDELKYVKVLKKWLNNEKKYMSKLKLLTKKIHIMPKLYSIEKRESFEKEYLKVFLRNKENINEVVKYIASLQSVRTANITQNKEPDITVYPSKTYTTDETIAELDAALGPFFGRGQYDPIFSDKIVSLSNNAFDNILDQIYNFGQNLEKFQSLKDKFDEEGYRDFFLPHLNSISKNHTATGETFNKIGKTDILIQDEDGINVFIGELKLWKGESELLKAIDQLLDRYVNWRDEKVALVIFNKNMKDFTELLKRAVDGLKKHPLYNAYIGKRKDSSFRFTFKHPDDAERIITIELIIFNCA